MEQETLNLTQRQKKIISTFTIAGLKNSKHLEPKLSSEFLIS